MGSLMCSSFLRHERNEPEEHSSLSERLQGLPTGILLCPVIRQVADTQLFQVHACGLEDIDLIVRTFRTAFVRIVGEDRETRPEMGPGDSSYHLAFVRVQFERGANLAERPPPLACRILNELVSNLLFAFL